ncbi:MAG TPA: iron-containing alcohol dehydrogenase, partial [Methanobacteriales archaeon]|nr:iron-containing alcohol dehydrogenase [Methanobacteriales archaeon]HIH61230.1 iron-containing alcohol dehydrogenase [Methanobacteriales archaeon]
MNPRKIELPREIHTGPGVIKNTGIICKDLRFKGKVMVVTGYKTFKIAGKDVIGSLEAEDFEAEYMKVKEASMESVMMVKENLDDISLVLGVGGGKVIDVAKMAATLAGLSFISVPTAASHDGIASPRASIRDGERGSVSMKATSPIGVIADTDIIIKAPFRLLASGCADIVSNYT